MPLLELLRHAMTQGNLEKRWTGVTDEPLAPEGAALARRCARPQGRIPRRVWVSPLLRCRQTASLLFPGAELMPLPGLRETDFGPFENKNHQELAGDPLYEDWTRSVGRIPVPGLESREEVAARALWRSASSWPPPKGSTAGGGSPAAAGGCWSLQTGGGQGTPRFFGRLCR